MSAPIETAPFCFLHIPKTGGVTFHNVLVDQFAWKKRISFSSKQQAEAYYNKPATDKRNYKLIKGHFWFDFEKFSPTPDSIYFTFLRQPTDRMVSHYYFMYQNPKHWFYTEMTTNNYSLKQLLVNGKVLNMDNCMVRFLSGNVLKPWGELDLSDLALAIKNFDTYFTHFGINEFYDESLLIVANELGWKTPYYARLNIGTMKKKDPFDAETLQLMKHFNSLDLLLYEHAMQKFKVKLEDNKNLLQSKLASFKEENKKYSTWRVKLYPYLGSRLFR